MVVAGLLRDYLVADVAERGAIRSQVAWASEFCAAGAERIAAGWRRPHDASLGLGP